MNTSTLKSAKPDQRREWVLDQISNLIDFKPLSNSTFQLVEACQNPQFDAGSLVKIIESDPAIMARVLAVANSPLYGYSREIGSIQHALVVLGKRTITRLALSFGTSKGFCQEGPEQKFRRQLYDHSLACGLIARALTQIERETDPETAFLGGVLHDIGKLVFCQLFSTVYTELFETPEDASSAAQIEEQFFGISHEEVGKLCATQWGFPVDISNVIGGHHGTVESPVDSPLGIIVEAADYLDGSRDPGEEFCNPETETVDCGNHLINKRDPQLIDPLLKIAWGDYRAIARAV